MGDICALSPLLCVNGAPPEFFGPCTAFGFLFLFGDGVGMMCGKGRGVGELLGFGDPWAHLTE